MRVLPDTPMWSAALRRAEGAPTVYRQEMERLVANGLVEIIGPIRQELLSGIRDISKLELIKDRLRVFTNLEVLAEDYEDAAAYYNLCRAKGIQGSSTDYLICAIAVRLSLAIFTDDRDFENYQRVLPIRLHALAKRGLTRR